MCHDVPMATKKTPIDIDALLREDIDEAIAATKYVPVTVFGQTRRVSQSPNTFAALAGSYGDVEALVSMIVGVIHEDDREEFRHDLLMAQGITADVLMKILNSLVEAASERPTKSPSDSSTGSAKTKVARQKSAAN